MARRRTRQAPRRYSGELLHEVVAAVVPPEDCERYMRFARELYAKLRHESQASSRRLQGRLGTRSEIAKPISVMSPPPECRVAGYTPEPVKRVVLRWFRRGLSGHLMWLIGKRLLSRMYPAVESDRGLS
jgi:hypothetical protein